jgi:hypothetical protein
MRKYFGRNLLVFLSTSAMLLSSFTLAGNVLAGSNNTSNSTGTGENLKTALVRNVGGCLEGTGPFTDKPCKPCDPIRATAGLKCNIGGGLGAYFPMPVLKKDLNGTTGKLGDLSMEELIAVLHATPEKEFRSILMNSTNSTTVEKLIPLIVESKVTPANLENAVDALCDIISSKDCPEVEGGSGGEVGTAELGPFAACAAVPACINAIATLTVVGMAKVMGAILADPVYSCQKDMRYPDADLVCTWR